MLIVGLTGSIAMGKSTTADIFKELGYWVFDADKTVHDLYKSDKTLIKRLKTVCPKAIKGGVVDRTILSEQIAKDKSLLKKIEQIVHPLVQQHRQVFVERAKNQKQPFVILDIPLLFETGNSQDVDKVIVVSTSAQIQRQRALERPNMTAEKFEFILSKQISDEIKRQKADFIIDTSVSRADAVVQVKKIITELDESALRRAKP